MKNEGFEVVKDEGKSSDKAGNGIVIVCVISLLAVVAASMAVGQVVENKVEIHSTN